MKTKKAILKNSSEKKTTVNHDYSIWDAQFKAAIKAGQKTDK